MSADETPGLAAAAERAALALEELAGHLVVSLGHFRKPCKLKKNLSDLIYIIK